MPDDMTKRQRSKTMSRIRSKWTKQEIAVHKTLNSNGVVHEMHPDIQGRPDLIVPGQKLAIYLQGCFWHKCPECSKPPKSNQNYWIPKLDRNGQRDIENEIKVREAGWDVVVIWEHEIKKAKQDGIKDLLRSKGILVKVK